MKISPGVHLTATGSAPGDRADDEEIAAFGLSSFGFMDPLVYGPFNLIAASLDRLLPMDRITCNWQCVLQKI